MKYVSLSSFTPLSPLGPRDVTTRSTGVHAAFRRPGRSGIVESIGFYTKINVNGQFQGLKIELEKYKRTVTFGSQSRGFSSFKIGSFSGLLVVLHSVISREMTWAAPIPTQVLFTGSKKNR